MFLTLLFSAAAEKEERKGRYGVFLTLLSSTAAEGEGKEASTEWF